MQIQIKQGFGMMGSHKFCVKKHLVQASWCQILLCRNIDTVVTKRKHCIFLRNPEGWVFQQQYVSYAG